MQLRNLDVARVAFYDGHLCAKPLDEHAVVGQFRIEDVCLFISVRGMVLEMQW